MQGIRIIEVAIGSHPDEQAEKMLIEILEHENARILFSINEWGLDSKGILAAYLLRTGIVHVNWFVDDPFFEELMQVKKFHPSPLRLDFVSDKGYLEQMSERNYNAFYLPLGTDPSLFYPIPEKEKLFDIVFVGNSYRKMTEKYLRIIEESFDDLLPVLNGVVELYRNNVEYDIEQHIREKLSTRKLPPTTGFDKMVFIAKQVACYLQRKQLILALAQKYPQMIVFGEEGWLQDLPPERVRRATYYDGLPDVYRSARIVIDINRVVIRNGFTQRIFDALSCSSFVITSSKPVVYETFAISGSDQEVAAFSNYSNLVQQIDYYLANNRQREAVAERGFRKVRSAHTYDHRAAQILSTVSTYLGKIKRV